MRLINRYEAKDGRLFTDQSSCIKWELLIDDCSDTMKLFGSEPPPNGQGYVQHDPATVLEVKTRLLKIAYPYFKWHDVFRADPATVHPMGIAGRIISDSDISPIRHAWNRLCCIDDQSREWDQPYFALHPMEGKQVRLNP
jgi:hypothetical protein